MVAVCDIKKDRADKAAKKYGVAVENDREPFISGKEALKIQKLICDIYEKGRF